MQHSKARSRQPKRTVSRTKTANKKPLGRPRFSLSRFAPKNKKGAIKVSLALVVFVAAIGAIPFPYSFTKDTVAAFGTVYEKHPGLELGDSKVIQEGRNGRNTVKIEALQSMWGRLFGWEPLQQKEVSEGIAEAPVDRKIVSGSRKYQYMLCSNGSYRYYNDDQFKDPNVGFTSKSSDYCKENNQGVKHMLADSANGAVNTPASPTVASNTPVPAGCRQTSVPFGTEYQNVSYLPRGTQQVASQGLNGFILHCPGKEDIKSSGVSQLVLVGTGKTAEEIQAENDAETVRKQQEAAARDQQYYINLVNCMQNLKAQGMQASSAESRCRSIITR